MPTVVPLTFNAEELCIVTINEKPWTRAMGTIVNWPRNSEKLDL